MSFNRNECSACALVEDLIIEGTNITLLLRQEKGQKTLNKGERNAQHVTSSETPRIAAMLAAFFTGQELWDRERAGWPSPL